MASETMVWVERHAMLGVLLTGNRAVEFWRQMKQWGEAINEEMRIFEDETRRWGGREKLRAE